MEEFENINLKEQTEEDVAQQNQDGIINEQEVNMEIPIVNFASLPFKPGKYIELQSGENIYRCVLEDGKLAMKFINMVKIFYKLKNEDKIKA